MYWSGYNFNINFTIKCMASFLISVLADEDLLKSVLECSDLVVSTWKRDHPSDTEDDALVWLSSKDEAEGLATQPRVARRGAGVPAAVLVEVPAAVLVVSQPSADEVWVKKRALKWVKHQVSALLHGEDLPEGAQAREVAEVPYQVQAVPKEAKDCLVCQQSFKTYHRLMKHMGVHRGDKFPCDKCSKVLANRKMLRRHTKACDQGCKVSCPDCGKEYASSQGMKQHHKAKHGVDQCA